VLLKNPYLGNFLFGKEFIQQCKSLEEIELGGKENQFLHDITFENEDGIQQFTENQNKLKNKLKMKLIRFEYCS